MKRRGMNKLGQGLPITTLILIVIGVVVAVVLILGFTKGFDFIFGKTELLPGTLQAKIESCKIADQGELLADYCIEFDKVEIAGEEQYVSCAYLASSGAGSLFKPEVLSSESCDDLDVKKKALDFCNNEELKPEKIVDGGTCESLRVDCNAYNLHKGVSGSSKESSDACSGSSSDVTKYVKKLSAGKVCCFT